MYSNFSTKKVPLLLSVLAMFAVSSYAQPGLNLGGHFIPKDSFMLFIDMGNSAMSGRTKSHDLVSEPHLWKYEVSPANHDWLPAAEPICADAYNTTGNPKGGPIMPFLKALHALYPTYYFGVIQLSNSGWELSQHFLNNTKAEYDTLMKYANVVKPNVTIAGLVSMFNTVEVQLKDTGNYLQNVSTMVSNMRSYLGSLSYMGVSYTVPYIHAGYPVLAQSNTTAQYDTSLAQTKSIMRQISQVPGTVSNSVVIPTDGLTICLNCDPQGYLDHYDSAGNAGWGTRTADTVFARAWIPPMSTAVSPFQQRQLLSYNTPLMQKVLFDGTNWSVFEKAGKSFSLYSPNGKLMLGLSSSSVRRQNLTPGIYIVRPAVEK
ncbi:MAG TPA: sialate O-acetylesterase [Chitinivibrionales bacterium]|nr:sialate O-acetylesterase [Chitinivibrionales bacterium]